MTMLHSSIAHIPVPPRMARLPVDARGYPVPYFVQWVDAAGQSTAPGTGTPDFRIMDREKFVRAVREHRCWLCGDVLGTFRAFVIGPMCAVNRVSSEPPSHVDCADYAARACPFLARPHAKRREAGLPDAAVEAREAHRDTLPNELRAIPGVDASGVGGFGIMRNPGVALVWITRGGRLESDGQGGVLFNVGEPVDTRWYAEGRRATRAEVLASIESGVPLLETACASEAPRDQPAARRELEAALARALTLIPAE